VRSNFSGKVWYDIARRRELDRHLSVPPSSSSGAGTVVVLRPWLVFEIAPRGWASEALPAMESQDCDPQLSWERALHAVTLYRAGSVEWDMPGLLTLRALLRIERKERPGIFGLCSDIPYWTGSEYLHNDSRAAAIRPDRRLAQLAPPKDTLLRVRPVRTLCCTDACPRCPQLWLEAGAILLPGRKIT
jgi:hypothetical protein